MEAGAEPSESLDPHTAWLPGPDRAQPAIDELHVWIADLEGRWPGPAGLPPGERKRAAGFLRPETARRWTAARWALRSVLSRYLEIEPAAVELAVGEHGKPRLYHGPDHLYFNLSHSGSLALIATAGAREVGVDVEKIDAVRDVVRLAGRFLRRDDAAAVREAAAGDQAAVFYARWSGHEARLKCLGTGIGSPAPPGVPVTVRSLDIGPDYAAAVAIAGETLPPLRRYRAEP